MNQTVDPRQFWEEKILKWEDGRYRQSKAPSLIEEAANQISGSLRFRLKVAVCILAPRIAGKKVVELGCGSALLAKELLDLGAASYTGYDFANAAIKRGSERLAAAGLDDRARLEVAEVGNLKALDADVVFSLGLFDWLSLAEIDHVFACSGGAQFLHAIAEKRVSLPQWIHRAYVHFAYGHFTGAYRPKYFTVDEIAEIASGHGITEIHVFRHRKLSFGAILTSFPVAADLGLPRPPA